MNSKFFTLLVRNEDTGECAWLLLQALKDMLTSGNMMELAYGSWPISMLMERPLSNTAWYGESSNCQLSGDVPIASTDLIVLVFIEAN